MDLDDLLTAARPPVSPRTAALRDDLDTLITVTEPERPRRRRTLRLGLAAGLATAVVGVGAVASATGVLPGWTLWTTGSGQTCEVEVTAGPVVPGNGEPMARTFTEAEQTATLTAAHEFLAGVDYDAIDREAAIERWVAIQQKHARTYPDYEPFLGDSQDDLEITAVTGLVIDQLREHLAARGLDILAIEVGSRNNCRTW